MKRSMRVSAVVGLLCAVGLLLWPSSAQEQPSVVGAPLPEFIIAKDPGESELQIEELKTDKSSYLPNWPGVVQFKLNHEGYIYLLQIGPERAGKHEVRLLFPTKDQPGNFITKGENGEVRGEASFTANGPGFIQGIATPIPISVVESLDQPILGDDPWAVKAQILRKIQDRGISEGTWGALWVTYAAHDVEPFTTTEYGWVKVSVIDANIAHDCGGLIPNQARVWDAKVYVDSSSKPGVFTDPQPPFTPITAEVGTRKILVEALGYQSNLTTAIVVKNSTTYVCVKLKPAPTGWTQFRFEPPLPLANQDEVLFDASRSFALEYEWDFGDGTKGRTQDGIIRHLYKIPGDYTVTLVAHYLPSNPGYCPEGGDPPKQLTTQCIIYRRIQIAPQKVQPPPPSPTIPPVTLRAGQPGSHHSVYKLQRALNGLISKFKLSFNYEYRRFTFSEIQVMAGLLNADSGVKVTISFVDAQGQQEVLPTKARSCTLQTDLKSTEYGCTFQLPLGDAQEGHKDIDPLNDRNLTPSWYWEVVNAVKLSEVHIIIDIWLDIRYNGVPGGEIEVEYYDFQLEIG